MNCVDKHEEKAIEWRSGHVVVSNESADGTVITVLEVEKRIGMFPLLPPALDLLFFFSVPPPCRWECMLSQSGINGQGLDSMEFNSVQCLQAVLTTHLHVTMGCLGSDCAPAGVPCQTPSVCHAPADSVYTCTCILQSPLSCMTACART